MTSPLAAAFRQQAEHCANLGSPFLARLCSLLADNLRPGTGLTDRLFDWPGALGPRAESVPLRLCGGLHALALQGHDLAAVYPPNISSDAALWSAVSAALESEEAFLQRWLDSPPQTNEVQRSAVLIGAGHWLGAQFGLPLALSELGASAGLNLNWDRFALLAQGQQFGPDSAVTLTPDWSGMPPPKSDVVIRERRGVDLNPLDPRDPQDRLRLLAYLWADQPQRRRLTQAALELADHAPDRGDASDWLANRLHRRDGHCHMIYTTIAWQYFSPATQARGRALIEQAGKLATDDAPLAWFGMESDGQNPGAALTLRLWPRDLRYSFGRADYHGRWIQWINPDHSPQ